MVHDIFISHSAKDKTVADAVCAALERAAVRCWIAPRDVQPGRSFAGEITRAIQQSRVMVLIFSSNSNNSQQVLREVQLAVSTHLHIVQLRIEDVRPNDDLTYFLSTPHWLDAMTPPFEAHLQRLVTAVRALLGESASEPPPAAAPTSAPSAERQRGNRSGVYVWLALALLMGIGFPVWNHYRRTERSVPADSSSPAKSPTATPTVMREIVIEFPDVTLKTPNYSVSATPYLDAFGVSVTDLRPADSRIILINTDGLYGGDGIQATTSVNMLTQIGTANVPASFTLKFNRPATRVSVTRARVRSKAESGLTHPAWSAHALDVDGNEVSSQKEALLRCPPGETIAARVYTLEATGPERITSVRFDSSPTIGGRAFAAFDAVLIERITLQPAEPAVPAEE